MVSAAGFDVAAVRAHYPALADGWAYLDGAAGTQVPEAVIEATAQAYRQGIGNQGGAFAASARSDLYASQARAAVADLVGGVDPRSRPRPELDQPALSAGSGVGRDLATGGRGDRVAAGPRRQCAPMADLG